MSSSESVQRIAELLHEAAETEAESPAGRWEDWYPARHETKLASA